MGMDYSAIADELIRNANFDRSEPCYTEDAFRRKLNRNHKQELYLKHKPTNLQSACYVLKESELRYAMDSSGLTARQYEVYQSRVSGETFEEIGKRSGVSKQAIAKIYNIARNKVRLAMKYNPYKGLSQVYREEVSRTRRDQSSNWNKTVSE